MVRIHPSVPPCHSVRIRKPGQLPRVESLLPRDYGSIR